MTVRRSLPSSPDDTGVHATRRGGARRETTERVRFYRGTQEIEGWALNKSRGGLRAIVEEKLVQGEALEVVIGDDEARRPVRVVWIQEELDGSIIGLAFLDAPEGSVPPRPGSTPDL